MTLPYHYKCYIFSRCPLYIYISMSYNLCSICVCSITKSKFCANTLLFKVQTPFCALTYTLTCYVSCTPPPRTWGGVGNMSCKVLELYIVDVCLSIFSMINSSEALSLHIIRMKWRIAFNNVMETCVLTVQKIRSRHAPSA